MRRVTASFILNAGWLGLSPVISAKMHYIDVRRSQKSRKKFTKPLYFRFQGRSRSSMLVPPERLSWSISSACYHKQQVCVYVQLFTLLDELIAVK